MRKGRISLLLILTAIAFVLIAGCTSPTQSNVAPTNQTGNTSSSPGTTTSSAVTQAPTVSSSPLPSASTTASASPTPSQASSSGKITTVIYANNFFNAFNSTPRGTAVTTWGFNVVSQGPQSHILCGVPLTALVDGRQEGTLTPQSGQCFLTANYGLSAQETAGLSVGSHTLTIRYAGDNSYQPSEQTFTFTVT